jgi:predicted nucleotidyltransferase
MIKYHKLPKNLMQLLPAGRSYLQSHRNVLFAYLFGSLAKGNPTPLSDVDIAVFLKEGVNVANNKLELLGGLIDILQTDEIDLVILNSAQLPLLMNILKNKKIIVDKKPFARQTFESLTMRKYFDFSIKESDQLKRRYLHG